MILLLTSERQLESMVNIKMNSHAAYAIRHLNGCVNYLSCLIPHLTVLIKRLRDLTHKGVTFKRKPHHSEAGEKLNKALISAPVLAYFDTNGPVTVQCNASDFSLSGCLLQHANW